MRNPLRQIRWFADWLDDRRATRQDRQLREEYAPQVAEAEKSKDWNSQQELLSSWNFASNTVLDPVYARKAVRLIAKARKYGITVPSKPVNYDGTDDDWYLSQATGDWLLTRRAEERLRREIRAESRASYDEFRKWATLFFALLGSTLAFVSVLSNQRQPDPCPRNYYRADSGECVFASPIGMIPSQVPPLANHAVPSATPKPQATKRSRSN